MSTPPSSAPDRFTAPGHQPDQGGSGADATPTRADIPSGPYGTSTFSAIGDHGAGPTEAVPVTPAPTPYTPPARESSSAADDPWSAQREYPAQREYSASPEYTAQPEYTAPREYSGSPEEDEQGIFPAVPDERPRSRAAAHWWGVLIGLTLAPAAWFLLADGSWRVYWSLVDNPAAINTAGLVGLGCGLAVLAAVLLAARWSSVGSVVAGTIALLAGATFLLWPVRTLEALEAQQDTFDRFGGFGSNVYLYLVDSGMRGHLVVGGVILIFLGVVSHGARRLGRREQRARLAARAAAGENPFV